MDLVLTWPLDDVISRRPSYPFPSPQPFHTVAHASRGFGPVPPISLAGSSQRLNGPPSALTVSDLPRRPRHPSALIRADINHSLASRRARWHHAPRCLGTSPPNLLV
ncbi:hypothetical protein C8T65DRAFT_635822 [Cerioporus squamosus]|nr:hypothetical protein C8T65DRAFT_635822 [Cerioporus squamosus]